MQTHKQGTATAPGLIYRIGAASIMIGLLISICSGLLEGFVSALYSQLFGVLGIDEDLVTLTGSESGREIVVILGAGMALTGAFVYAFRMAIELLGFPVQRYLSPLYTTCDKLALGMAAIAYVVAFLSSIPLFVLEEVFYRNPATTLTSILNPILTVSGWMMLGGLVIFFLKARHRIRTFYNRVISFGWGKVGWTWVNKSAASIILFAVICQIFGWNSIFELTMNSIIVTGLIMILSGIVPHFLARGNP